MLGEIGAFSLDFFKFLNKEKLPGLCSNMDGFQGGVYCLNNIGVFWQFAIPFLE